jgi:antitoxin ParD1/3/4
MPDIVAVGSNTGRHFYLRTGGFSDMTQCYDNVIVFAGDIIMAERAAKPVTVTLGGMAKSAQAHVASGRYSSISEVVRAGLRALDREEEAHDAFLKQKIHDAYADPRPRLSLNEAFDELRNHATAYNAALR